MAHVLLDRERDGSSDGVIGAGQNRSDLQVGAARRAGHLGQCDERELVGVRRIDAYAARVGLRTVTLARRRRDEESSRCSLVGNQHDRLMPDDPLRRLSELMAAAACRTV